MTDQEHKLGWRFWFFYILLFGTLLLGLRAISMLLTGQVSLEDEPMPPAFAWIMSILFAIPLSSYLYSVVVMTKQLIRHQATALTITEQGIENTLTFVYLFAFVFVIPVKLIPWNSVKYWDGEETPHYIRVKVSCIHAPMLAKLILWIRGYMFCHSFCNPAVTCEEIARYKAKISSDDQ